MIAASLDTNALAPAITGQARPESIPGELFRRWQGQAYREVLGEHLPVELARTFAKPYYRRRRSLREVERAFRTLRRRGDMTQITVSVVGVATHPEDDLVLATAVSGAADYLVTGDKGLPAVGRYGRVQLLTPRDFLAVLHEAKPPDDEAAD